MPNEKGTLYDENLRPNIVQPFLVNWAQEDQYQYRGHINWNKNALKRKLTSRTKNLNRDTTFSMRVQEYNERQLNQTPEYSTPELY